MHHSSSRRRQSGKGLGGCLLIAGILFALVVACGYFGYKYGIGVMEEQVVAKLQDNPVIREHLGNLEKLEFDMMATAAVAEEEAKQAEEGSTPGSTKLVFDATGSKGKGRITIVVPDEDSDEIVILSGVLRTADGEILDLGPIMEAPETDATDADATDAAEPEEAPTEEPAPEEEPAGAR